MKIKNLQKRWLKKSRVKEKHDMQLISQKKMNVYFIGGLVGIVSLSILTIVVALTKTVTPVESDKPKVETTVNKADHIDNRLEAFLNAFVIDYFTIPKDTNAQSEQLEKILSYYNFEPDVVNEIGAKVNMSLVSSKLLMTKDDVATYRVTYEVGDDKKRVTVLFGIPYGGSEGSYYVSGLPYYQAVKDYKATEVPASDELILDESDGVEEEDRLVMTEFLELFFRNYTTNQDNLNLIADDVSTITGATFNGIDWSYFKKDGKGLKAYVQVRFTIAEVEHSENFTLTIISKDNSFYVKKLEHYIPVDYAK
ncbi:conjugal transfer protein [Streptococcus pluranimalium]